MDKVLRIRNILAILLIGVALYPQVKEFIPINPAVPQPNVSILKIEKPSDNIINLVNPVAKIVSDPTDRAKLAIFSQELSIRMKKYNDVGLQQLNDLISTAGEEFFRGSLNNKYETLSDGILSLIHGVTGDDNHTLSTLEKDKLSEIFMGFAWSLIQK